MNHTTYVKDQGCIFFHKELKTFRDDLKTVPNFEILFNSIFLQKSTNHSHKGSLEDTIIEVKL